MSDALTTAEVADQLGTDPKTLRKYFRSPKCDIEPVGQGKRYVITEDMIDDLRTGFEAYSKGSKAKAADADDDDEPTPDKAPAKAKAPRKGRGKKAKPAPEVIEDEDLGLDEDEPSSEDLEVISDDAADEIDDLEDLDITD